MPAKLPGKPVKSPTDFPPLGKLMHDFACANPDDMHYNELKDTVRYFKETKEGKEFMCEIIDEIRSKGRKEGRAEGINDNKKDVALRMLAFGKYALNEIAAISGLSVEEVKAIQAKLTASSRA